MSSSPKTGTDATSKSRALLDASTLCGQVRLAIHSNREQRMVVMKSDIARLAICAPGLERHRVML